MYEADRFNEKQNYSETYSLLGGKKLQNKILFELIHYIYNTLLERYRNPVYYDNFKVVRDFIEIDKNFSSYDKNEKDLIERVFAYHECGSIPYECKQVLKKLSQNHRLGIISNVWTYSKYYINKLKDENVYNFFEFILFSSDHGCIKPSLQLFSKAIEHFKKEPAEIVYIGDNYKRDVLGAKSAGMKSILVTNGIKDKVNGEVKPDYEIEHIRELI